MLYDTQNKIQITNPILQNRVICDIGIPPSYEIHQITGCSQAKGAPDFKPSDSRG
eukprot:c21309_g1_i2 orf=48-212(-)